MQIMFNKPFKAEFINRWNMVGPLYSPNSITLY